MISLCLKKLTWDIRSNTLLDFIYSSHHMSACFFSSNLFMLSLVQSIGSILSFSSGFRKLRHTKLIFIIRKGYWNLNLRNIVSHNKNRTWKCDASLISYIKPFLGINTTMLWMMHIFIFKRVMKNIFDWFSCTTNSKLVTIST